MRRPETREPSLTAPGILRHRVVWAAAAILLLVPFFMKIPRGLNNHPIIGPFGDQLHVVLLGIITLLLYWAGPLRGRAWWAASAAVVTGGAIEFLQIPFGRSAMLKDFMLDLLGIGLVTAWILWRGDRRPWAKTVFILLLAVLPIQMWRVPFIAIAASRNRGTFPMIADFEGPYDRFLWIPNMESEFEIAPVEDGPDGSTRVLRLTGAPPMNWPGVLIRRFPRDWTGYTALAADVRLVSGPEPTARLSIRLDDMPGVKEKVWIAKGYDVGPEWRTITLRFEGEHVNRGSGRVFDHTDLDEIIFYLPKPRETTVVEIDNVRLLGPAGHAEVDTTTRR